MNLGSYLRSAGLLGLMLLLCGCGMFFGGSEQDSPSKTLTLDEEFEYSVTISKDDLLELDIPQPTQAGYSIEGAAFDPSMLSLEHFFNSSDEGARRVRYIFRALQDGISDVLIKMRKEKDGRVEMYKRVTVNVGGAQGLF